MKMVSFSQSERIFGKSIAHAFKDMSGILLLISVILSLAFTVAGTQYNDIKTAYPNIHLFFQFLFAALACCYAKVRFEGKQPHFKTAFNQLFDRFIYIIGIAMLLATILFLMGWALVLLTGQNKFVFNDTVNSSLSTLTLFAFYLLVTSSLSTLALALLAGLVAGAVFFLIDYLFAMSIIETGSLMATFKRWTTTLPKTIIAFFVWMLNYILLILLMLPLLLGLTIGSLWLISKIAPAIAEQEASFIADFISSVGSIFGTGLLTAISGYFAAALAWYAVHDRLPNDYAR